MLTSILEKMKDADPAVRRAAEKELSKLGRAKTLTMSDAAWLVRRAADEFPKPEHDFEDTAASLLYVARDASRDGASDEIIAAVEDVFPRLSPEAKSAALQVVVKSRSALGAQAYIRFLRRWAPDLAGQYLPTFGADSGPAVAAALFPSLLDLLDIETAPSILETLLGFLYEHALPPEAIKSHHPALGRLLETQLQEVRRHQQASGLGWRDEAPYAGRRALAGQLLDLSGRLNSQTLLALVGSCEDLLDPRLRRFRAVSLLRRGVGVSDGELEWIARSPRDRYWLFDQMHELGLAARLPAACLRQEALAQGAMVEWLCYPTELGREADEIELLARETRPQSACKRGVSSQMKSQAVDYYFFKFRVNEEHWSKDAGWTVGMAGGYARAEQPTTSHDGGTFSRFGKLDDKTLAEHIADYLE